MGSAKVRHANFFLLPSPTYLTMMLAKSGVVVIKKVQNNRVLVCLSGVADVSNSMLCGIYWFKPILIKIAIKEKRIAKKI